MLKYQHKCPRAADVQVVFNLYLFLLKTGRRLMVRSKPPTTLRVDTRGLNLAAKNDEELAYFFT